MYVADILATSNVLMLIMLEGDAMDALAVNNNMLVLIKMKRDATSDLEMETNSLRVLIMLGRDVKDVLTISEVTVLLMSKQDVRNVFLHAVVA